MELGLAIGMAIGMIIGSGFGALAWNILNAPIGDIIIEDGGFAGIAFDSDKDRDKAKYSKLIIFRVRKKDNAYNEIAERRK